MRPRLSKAKRALRAFRVALFFLDKTPNAGRERLSQAALWTFYIAESFSDCVLAAANLGDDADTTAAVAGRISKSYYGPPNIPQAWRDKLAKRELIDGFADHLTALAPGDANPGTKERI
jgi:hypothetical protein